VALRFSLQGLLNFAGFKPLELAALENDVHNSMQLFEEDLISLICFLIDWR
jgi:hypothetical protein